MKPIGSAILMISVALTISCSPSGGPETTRTPIVLGTFSGIWSLNLECGAGACKNSLSSSNDV